MKKILLVLALGLTALIAQDTYIGTFVGGTTRTSVNLGFEPSYVEVYDKNTTNTVFKYADDSLAYVITGSTGAYASGSTSTTVTTGAFGSYTGFDINTTAGNVYFYKAIR